MARRSAGVLDSKVVQRLALEWSMDADGRKALQEVLTKAFAEAAERWPGFAPNVDAFVRRIEELMKKREVALSALGDLALADLLLATSCLAGDRTARLGGGVCPPPPDR